MSHDLSEHELELLRIWNTINKKILFFQKQANDVIFEEVFGKSENNVVDSEGLRLFHHFKVNCQLDYQKLTEYLTIKQHTALLTYIIRNY